MPDMCAVPLHFTVAHQFRICNGILIEYAIIQVMPKKIDQAVNHRCIADFDETLFLPKWVPEAMLIRMDNISSSDVSDPLTNCASLVASRMT